jgi:RepB plasmid partitioning protein
LAARAGKAFVELADGQTFLACPDALASYRLRVLPPPCSLFALHHAAETTLGTFDKSTRQAIERGVSEEKLAKALNVDIKRIKIKRTLLDGVCPEVAEMLKDKSVDTQVFALFRQGRAGA